MNGFDVHDNCPQLPNPVYRMREGWLQPFALDSAQQFDSLRAIETSYKCGVITIYGKPSASPDFSTGESFVIENRRRIGFDRKIVSNEILRDPRYGNFKGGLLVWQFSPYVVREDFCSLGTDKVSLVHTDTVLCIASIRETAIRGRILLGMSSSAKKLWILTRLIRIQIKDEGLSCRYRTEQLR